MSDTIPVKSGLVFHLTGAEGVQTNAGKVTSWTDVSPYGLSLTAPAHLEGPTLVSNGLNGKPVVSFDGVNDALESLDISQLPSGAEEKPEALKALSSEDWIAIPGGAGI